MSEEDPRLVELLRELARAPPRPVDARLLERSRRRAPTRPARTRRPRRR
ncbi:MAG TPA: hypothetical protein VFF06_36545 [Polyangia bacterium]|nr:hypothetical protein [Polyangia bacterium]